MRSAGTGRLTSQAGIDFLKSRPDVDPERIGGIGFSVGGEMLLEAAAKNDDLKAVVSEGAGIRSFKEGLELGGVQKWIQRPMWASTTVGVALWGNSTPPANLADLVGDIAPRAVMFIYAEHGQGGEELNPTYYEAAGEPKELWQTDSSHVAGYDADPDEYAQQVTDFFNEALLAPANALTRCTLDLSVVTGLGCRRGREVLIKVVEAAQPAHEEARRAEAAIVKPAKRMAAPSTPIQATSGPAISRPKGPAAYAVDVMTPTTRPRSASGVSTCIARLPIGLIGPYSSPTNTDSTTISQNGGNNATTPSTTQQMKVAPNEDGSSPDPIDHGGVRQRPDDAAGAHRRHDQSELLRLARRLEVDREDHRLERQVRGDDRARQAARALAAQAAATRTGSLPWCRARR